MRDTSAEQKLFNRLLAVAGGAFLLGLIALAVGAEILIISMWDEPVKFWCWQGVWLIVQGFVLATVAKLAQSGNK
jgi:hypothetical protein